MGCGESNREGGEQRQGVSVPSLDITVNINETVTVQRWRLVRVLSNIAPRFNSPHPLFVAFPYFSLTLDFRIYSVLFDTRVHLSKLSTVSKCQSFLCTQQSEAIISALLCCLVVHVFPNRIISLFCTSAVLNKYRILYHKQPLSQSSIFVLRCFSFVSFYSVENLQIEWIMKN